MALVDLLSGNQGILIAFASVLGLLVGSFLNVVVYRLPIMLQREWRAQCCEFLEIENISPDPSGSTDFKTFNLIKPESHCPHCHAPVKPWQNIPVISYLMLGAKCANCQVKIPKRYPAVEAITGLLSALVVYTYGFDWVSLAALVFTWSLIALTLIDFDHQLLPDNVTIPLLWLGLLVGYLDLGLVPLGDAVIGAIAGYLVLWIFYWSFKLLTGKEGMGYGDFKLLAALGAWLGWQSLLPIIILSSMAGAVIGMGMILLFKRDRSIPMPFGPYLAIAGFIMLIWGPQLTSMYVNGFLG
ncbi:MAG: A24 family peptidase [Pseudohongiellaceae bacterium]